MYRQTPLLRNPLTLSLSRGSRGLSHFSYLSDRLSLTDFDLVRGILSGVIRCHFFEVLDELISQDYITFLSGKIE